jgi:hypothetical protein
MRTAVRARPGADPDALIREARRRQRLRYLLTACALLATCGTAAGLYAIQRDHPTPPRPALSTPRPSPAASHGPTAPRLPFIAAKVLMWPPSIVDDLRTGHSLQTEKFDLCCGDYQPLMITVGRWLVYVGDGATAIRSDLTGQRLLGKTPFFAPSAAPGEVWLEDLGTGKNVGSDPIRIRQVPVTGGAAGPAITLPAGSQLVAGTRAGLLLQNRHGRLRLWLGGRSMRALPGNPYWGDGFAVTPTQIAYGTHCRSALVPVRASFEPNAGYGVCSVLSVFDVRSWRVQSFRSPAGTTGWVPPEFYLEYPLAPDGSMMAAEAVVPSPDNNRGRLYVLHLAGEHRHPVAVPLSDGYLFSKAAWSPDGSWLLYQGPRHALWATTSGPAPSGPPPCRAVSSRSWPWFALRAVDLHRGGV